jgi:methylenetetrahydrofolate reductase (NADPH)
MTTDLASIPREGPTGGGEPRRTFRTRLAESTSFVRIVELVTTRGPLTGPNPSRVIALASGLAQLGSVDVLSITDNAGGHPTLAAEALGQMLRERNQEVMVHLSCKDSNRNGLESRSWALASAGFENLLCLSGDYPSGGYSGGAKPVFDLDSVALLEMLKEMNQGLRTAGSRKGETTVLPLTHFFLGAAVSPFKQQERELLPQFYKLARKIAAGAEFIITQVGYDSRKLQELQRYCALKQLAVPLIANVYVLSVATARFFHRRLVPGVVVSDALLALAEKQAEAPDKGKTFFRELAAQQIAIARGLGFRGAYLAGQLKAEEFQAIFALADSYGPDDWKAFARGIQFPQPDEFYLFEPDPSTGLSSGELNQTYLASLTPESRRALRAKISMSYKLDRFVHDHVFTPGTPAYALARGFYERIDASPSTKRSMHRLEQAIKGPLFNCQDCCDCSLPDIAYLCPESQCVKNQRNGPCGGSREGTCEVPPRPCIWARAYDRLKPYGEEEHLLDRPTVIKDGSLRSTCGWANYFLERDHHARKPNEEG